MKQPEFKRIAFALILASVASLAQAQGLGTVSRFFTNLNTALHALAAVVIVTAIIVCGIKIAFNGESIRDCKNWIIGAALIAGATEIANLFFANGSM